MQTQEQFLNEFIRKYNAKTASSKQRAQANREFLADCRASAGFRFSTKELLYQIVAKKGRAAYFYDIDNNKYIDIAMGFGVLLFGHYPKFIRKQIKREASRGIQLGAESNYTFETAKLFCELTQHDRVTFCNSGTEANMTAIRLARLHTKRRKIVLFSGSYHGFYDATLVVPDDSKPLLAAPLTTGLIPEIEQDVLLLEYGNIEQLNLLEQYKNDIAAIMVEPVRSRLPDIQDNEFLNALRAYADLYKAVLIFDEVITGFRCSQGGAQRYFNVKADIATYGKILGGGLPIGAIGGTQQMMSGIDGGFWKYGDDTFPGEETTFFAGTFSKNPLVMASANAILKEIKSRGPSLQANLNVKTRNMVNELNEFLRIERIPIHIANFSSLFRFEINANADLFFYLLLYHGLYVWEGRNFFLSTAHTDQDIRSIIETIKKCALMFHENGFLKTTKAQNAIKNKISNPMPMIQVKQPHESDNAFALSCDQKDLFDLIGHNTAARIAYNEGILIGLKGNLDEKRLIEAFGCVANMHQAFRINFERDGSKQRIKDKIETNVPIYDIKNYSVSEKVEFIKNWSSKCINTNFDLYSDTLFKLEITQLSDQFHIVSLIMPNIVMDGLSSAKMFKDWFTLYNGVDAEIEIMDYSSFIQEQNDLYSKSQMSQQYWINLFNQSNVMRLNLGASKPRPKKMSFSGNHHIFSIESAILSQLRTLAKSHQTTLFVIMMSLYFYHLRSYGNNQDILLGVPFGNRSSNEMYNTVGFCISLVPIILSSNRLSDFSDFVVAVKEQFINAIDHHSVPFPALLKQLPIECNDSYPLLFDTLFNMETADSNLVLEGCDDIQFASMTSPYCQLNLAPVGGEFFHVSSGHAQFDLTFNVLEDKTKLSCCFEYNTDIFTHDDIQKHVTNLLNLITQIIRGDDLSIAS